MFSPPVRAFVLLLLLLLLLAVSSVEMAAAAAAAAAADSTDAGSASSITEGALLALALPFSLAVPDLGDADVRFDRVFAEGECDGRDAIDRLLVGDDGLFRGEAVVVLLWSEGLLGGCSSSPAVFLSSSRRRDLDTCRVTKHFAGCNQERDRLRYIRRNAACLKCAFVGGF